MAETVFHIFWHSKLLKRKMLVLDYFMLVWFVKHINVLLHIYIFY